MAGEFTISTPNYAVKVKQYASSEARSFAAVRSLITGVFTSVATEYFVSGTTGISFAATMSRMTTAITFARVVK